jgi:hypothetical protein
MPALDTLVVELRLVLNNQFFLRSFGVLFHKLTKLNYEFLAVLARKSFYDFIFKMFELSQNRVSMRPETQLRLVVQHISFIFFTPTYTAESKHLFLTKIIN